MARVSEPKPGEPIRLVERQGGVRYRVTLDVGAHPNGRRRQLTRMFPTLKQARAFVTETRADQNRGTFAAPATLTLAELANAWLKSKHSARAITTQDYRWATRSLLNTLGDRKVQSIRRADLDTWLAQVIRDGGPGGRLLSHRSLSYMVMATRQLFEYGVSSGVLPANPAAHVKTPRARHGEAKAEMAVWTPEEMLRFRHYADNDEWAAAWRLTLCGMRRSEVMGLHWTAVDLEAGTVEVTAGRVTVGKDTIVDAPKSSASRRIVPVEAMHPGTMNLLRQLKARQTQSRLAAGTESTQNDLVLVDESGQAVRPELYSDRFQRLCVAAGVPKIRMHATRHTTALLLHRAGVAPADAAALLGHSVAVHLRSYVPSTHLGAANAAAAFGRALGTDS